MINVIYNKLKNIKQFIYLSLAMFFLMSNLVYGGDELNKVYAEIEKEHKNLKIFKDLPDEFFHLLENGKASLDFVGVTSRYIENLGVSKAALITCHGRCSRNVTLDIISRSNMLLIPSHTEGNPKVVWEAVELGVTPIISQSLTFSGYYHQIYPYTFDPESADSFWSAIQLVMTGHSSITLSKYFTISGRNDVRKIYEEAYFNRGLE